MTRPRPVPLPPAVKPSPLPTLLDERVGEMWRLHWEPDPRFPKKHSRGRFRFDAPAGQYPVTYCNDDRFACFAEVYGDRQSVPPGDTKRLVSVLRSERPLSFVTLDDGTALKQFHPQLDDRVSSDLHYSATRAWSLALYEWFPNADGIRYVARHGTPHFNRCLFLDRCAESIVVEPKGTLSERRDLVQRACDAYGLAPRLFEPRDTGGW